MRWDYDPKWRDMFDDGVHRDILIVPHATSVTKVSGDAPIVTSKVPKFYPDNDPDSSHHIDNNPSKGGKAIPDEFEPVEWTITNEDIIKEKFEFTDSLCSNDKLTFGCCESSMIKFTIRNNKTYNDETQRWELDVPNLQTYQILSDDGTELLGEVQGSAVINVWTYINGDSDSLMWLGMYKVEQDKVTGDGYEREIIAYDFMLTFRDMDIFEWYKALFKGTPIDSTDESKGYNTKIPKADEWTIGEALKCLFENLAYYSPGKATTTNPKDYLLDISEDKYPGYGMPIIIDPDIQDMTIAPLVVPTIEMDPDEPCERYGGMKIFDLPFRMDEKIIKKGSLSCGKFLEDIAALAGRFGMIRKDSFVDDTYHYDSGDSYHYNHYEKCILTFRPLPTTEDYNPDKANSNDTFTNDDVEKGIQWELYDVRETKIIDVYDYDGNRLFYYCPSGLKKATKKEWEAGNRNELNVFTIMENMFTSYLKKTDTNNKFVIELLKTGKSTTRQVPDWTASMARPDSEKSQTPVMKTVTYDGTALLLPCFKAVKDRPYRPYQLGTFADLCRMPGDVIHVKGIDRITNEEFEFTSFVLCRRVTGIQKMMDKYTAKGDISNGTYSDYRSGELNDSFHPQSLGYARVPTGNNGGVGANSEGDVIQGLTSDDLIEYLRNIGFRFPDEPTIISTEYDRSNGSVSIKWTDPSDIASNEPAPSAWAGTVVVRKEGGIPKHRWDGTLIVDSTVKDQYSSTALVDNTVDEGTTYYYGVFPYDTKGDYRYTKVIKFDTDLINVSPEILSIKMGGSGTWDGSEVAIMWSGDNNKLTVQISNSTILFKLYSDNTVIYSWTSAVGTSVSDADKIHVSFLTDDTNEVAKPSFVYETASGVYSYNQESPTDAEMGDIWDWLLASRITEHTLEDLIKTSDLSHYKTGSLFGDYSELSSYIGTDWDLALLSKQNSVALQRNQNEYYFNYSGGNNDSFFAIPLKQIYQIKKISVAFKKPDALLDSNNVMYVKLKKSSSNNLTDAGGITVYKCSSTPWSYDYIISDSEYHTFEKTFDTVIEADYIEFRYAVSSSYFKDIKITVVQ